MQSALSTRPGFSHRYGSLQQSLSGKIFLAVAATAFVTACAYISIPLPFTPVPLTLQNFAVILVGLFLGPVAGFSAMVLYLAEGAVGLPVFTPHSAGGIAHLIGPNAGYLFAYPLAAAAAGWTVGALQRVTSRFRAALVASTVASLPIFILGACWLSHLLRLGASTTWTLAVAPFIPGEIIKITAAAAIFSSLQRWRQS
jgi:biotin transport system substrate-specific component